jgi:hypothetical protein
VCVCVRSHLQRVLSHSLHCDVKNSALYTEQRHLIRTQLQRARTRTHQVLHAVPCICGLDDLQRARSPAAELSLCVIDDTCTHTHKQACASAKKHTRETSERSTSNMGDDTVECETTSTCAHTRDHTAHSCAQTHKVTITSFTYMCVAEQHAHRWLEVAGVRRRDVHYEIASVALEQTHAHSRTHTHTDLCAVCVCDRAPPRSVS